LFLPLYTYLTTSPQTKQTAAAKEKDGINEQKPDQGSDCNHQKALCAKQARLSNPRMPHQEDQQYQRED